MLKVDWLKVLGLAKKNWKEIIIIILLFTVIGKMHYDYKQLESAYEVSQQSLQYESLEDPRSDFEEILDWFRKQSLIAYNHNAFFR